MRALVTPARYMVVVVGAGLFGWAIGGAVGFVMGLGAGLILLGFTTWLVGRLNQLPDAEPPASAVRMSLQVEDFRRLVSGLVVELPGGGRLLLADIGYTVMLAEIHRAMREERHVQ